MHEKRRRGVDPLRCLNVRVGLVAIAKASRRRLFCLVLAPFALLGFLSLSQHLISSIKVARIATKAHETAQVGPLIPKKIWQIYLRPPNYKGNFQLDPTQILDTTSWLAQNPDYSYHLVGDQGAARALHRHKLSNPKLRHIYHELPNTGMKSDLLRYLLLASEGGVYSDTDVEALRPIDHWIPKRHSARAKVVVGIEFDRLDGSNWPEVHDDIQFCQWTIAAAPNHPLLLQMITSIFTRLQSHSAELNPTVGKFKFTSWDVINITGPSAWTEAVFNQLRMYQPNLTSVRNLTGLTEPTLIGDILILPIDAFGMGQVHSNSTNDGSIPENALVRHKFRGSWRKETERS